MLEMKRQQRLMGYRRPILLSTKILCLLIIATQSTMTSAFAPPTLQRNLRSNTMRVKNRRRVYSLSYMSIGDDNNASINKQEADDRSNAEDNIPKQTTISGE